MSAMTLLFSSFAVSLSSPLGGFLCGVIIPLPTYPLSPIHPEGSHSLQQSGGVQGRHVVHGPRIRIGGPHQAPARQDQEGYSAGSWRRSPWTTCVWLELPALVRSARLGVRGAAASGAAVREIVT